LWLYDGRTAAGRYREQPFLTGMDLLLLHRMIRRWLGLGGLFDISSGRLLWGSSERRLGGSSDGRFHTP